MKRIVLFILMALLCGCALVRGTQIAGIRTFDGLSESYPADARQLAIQAALELSRRYPAGQTSLALVSVPGQFGVSLEEELRVFGFALLTPTSGSNGLHVGYLVDEVADEQIPTGYLQIRTSDGTLFSIVRQLKGGLLPAPVVMPSMPSVSGNAPLSSPSSAPSVPSVQSTPLSPSATPASVQTSRPISTPSPVQPIPVTAPRTTGSQNTLLPKAVLTVLPYDWRYQIPDVSKRSLRVGWPKNVPWRESIRAMATEAKCEARFDESARRVTLLATVDTRRVSTASTSAPTAPVSALHPASLPEVIPPKAPPLTTPKPEVKVEVPTQEPAVIQDALGGGVSAPAATPASAKPEVLPVIPASSLASIPHLPPAKTEESDGSNSLLLQAQKSKAS
ncbi:MAG: hypothetical protein RRY20_06505, partial [Bilophila sp.]